MIFKLMDDSKQTPIIKVIGVGGGGSNAVNHMYKQGIVGVDFAICNTDAQAMELSPVGTKIHLGPTLTEGRGAGSKPNIGRMACEESLDEIKEYLSDDCKMLFVTAGMGGGTGTGAAPLIAKTAQEMDILTVGIVTLPFTFEGRRRTNQGSDGLDELKKYVDALIVISNNKLRQIYGNMSLSDAFSQADNILNTAAKGIAEIITVPGYVNVDFEDVNTVMRDSGVAIMGTSVAEGDNRAKKAVDGALNSPLLEDNNIKGAQHILLNVTSGSKEVTMDEIFEITEFVQEEAGFGTDLIWGNCYDESLGEKLSVTIIATGFERNKGQQVDVAQNKNVRVSLDDDDIQNTIAISNTPANSISNITADNDDPKATVGSTFEFNDVRDSIEKYNKSQYSYDEPYVKKEEQADFEAMKKEQAQAEAQRRERSLQVRPKLNNPQTVNEMENQPAYLRRRITLDNIQPSKENPLSKWTINDDAEPEINEKGNSYLHDNVD